MSGLQAKSDTRASTLVRSYKGIQYTATCVDGRIRPSEVHILRYGRFIYINSEVKPLTDTEPALAIPAHVRHCIQEPIV